MECEIHICPFLMRTVRFDNGFCAEECEDKGDCPIREEMKRNAMEDSTNEDCL